MIIDLQKDKEVVELDIRDKPSLYEISFLNDEYTKFNDVIDLAQEYFNMNENEAWDVAFEVDTGGHSVVGKYTRDVAETKLSLAKKFMQSRGNPFKMEVRKV